MSEGSARRQAGRAGEGRKGRHSGRAGQARGRREAGGAPTTSQQQARAHTNTHESVAPCGQNPTSPKRKTPPNAAGVRDGDDQDSPLHSSHSQLLFEVLARDCGWVSEEWG
jgi:hypothetical protein